MEPLLKVRYGTQARFPSSPSIPLTVSATRFDRFNSSPASKPAEERTFGQLTLLKPTDEDRRGRRSRSPKNALELLGGEFPFLIGTRSNLNHSMKNSSSSLMVFLKNKRS